MVLSLMTPASLVDSETSPSQPPPHPEPEDLEKNLLALHSTSAFYLSLSPSIHLSCLYRHRGE